MAASELRLPFEGTLIVTGAILVRWPPDLAIAITKMKNQLLCKDIRPLHGVEGPDGAKEPTWTKKSVLQAYFLGESPK
jgi:hypothetical protein